MEAPAQRPPCPTPQARPTGLSFLPIPSSSLPLPSPPLLFLCLLSGLHPCHPPCLLLFSPTLPSLGSLPSIVLFCPPDPVLTSLDWLPTSWPPQCNSACSLHSQGQLHPAAEERSRRGGCCRATLGPAPSCFLVRLPGPSLRPHPQQGVSFPPQWWRGSVISVLNPEMQLCSDTDGALLPRTQRLPQAASGCTCHPTTPAPDSRVPYSLRSQGG